MTVSGHLRTLCGHLCDIVTLFPYKSLFSRPLFALSLRRRSFASRVYKHVGKKEIYIVRGLGKTAMKHIRKSHFDIFGRLVEIESQLVRNIRFQSRPRYYAVGIQRKQLQFQVDYRVCVAARHLSQLLDPLRVKEVLIEFQPKISFFISHRRSQPL